jgi:hypothetical protein
MKLSRRSQFEEEEGRKRLSVVVLKKEQENE